MKEYNCETDFSTNNIWSNKQMYCYRTFVIASIYSSMNVQTVTGFRLKFTIRFTQSARLLTTRLIFTYELNSYYNRQKFYTNTIVMMIKNTSDSLF